MSSIFIQIACYHDLELLETIKDVLNKSSENNDLHFGVHNCFFEENPHDESFMRSELNKLNRNYKLSIKHSKFPDNIGMGLGRYIANEFYSNEDFYMQIDSHMMFMHKWDEVLIGLLNEAKKTGIEKPIISDPTNAYFVDGNGQRQIEDKSLFDHFKNKNFDVQKLIEEQSFAKAKYNISGLNERNEVSTTFKHCFDIDLSVENLHNIFEFIYINGAFIFGDGTLHAIKPNRNLLLIGDETLTSSRFYTHGYTVLRTTDIKVCCHLTRTKPGLPGEDWIVDRRRESQQDLRSYNEAEGEGEIIFRKLYEKNIMELRKILGLRIKDDQSLGNERDYQEVIDSLL
jgi:hypothetical protein